MKGVSLLLVVLVGLVAVSSAQPFNYPPRLRQNFDIGDENYLVVWGGAAIQGARHYSAAGIDDAPNTARKFAIIATTFSDIVNAFQLPQEYEFYGNASIVAPEGANVLAAIAGAGYEVFNLLYPLQTLDWQVIYKTQIDLLRRGPFSPSPTSVSAGFNFGRDLANDRYTQFANDGHDAPSTWTVPARGDGAWQPTPRLDGQIKIPTGAQFTNATTWVIPHASSFRPEGPSWNYPATFVNNFREVASKGSAVSNGIGRRTIVETFTATFFSVEIPGLQQLPGLFYDISIEVARENELPLFETSRLLALTALALVDASYATADAKFHFNDWRPYTAITTLSPAAAARLELDVDPNWEPLLQTLGCPDYVGIAPTLGAAAASVWRRFIGTDNFDFFVTTDALPGVSATYSSFSQFIDDVGYSAVFSGNNWRKSSEDGIQLGQIIGNYVYDHALVRVSS